jgi:hypothetical protein
MAPIDKRGKGENGRVEGGVGWLVNKGAEPAHTHTYIHTHIYISPSP